jgi:hypothetical protein
METQPPKKSKRVWWIVGGIVFVAVVAIAASGSSGTPTSSTAVTPAVQSQTANIEQQVAPSPVAQPQVEPQQNNLSNNNYYTNSDGNAVHSPAYSNAVPAGATAQCRDGTYSFSQHRSGTCSSHGGVAIWL